MLAPNQEYLTRTKWLEALRSRRYKQGFSQLRGTSTYCALGVLCDVVAPERWTGFGPLYAHDGSYSSPSNQVLKAAGLSKREALHVTYFNDQGGRSFEEIADWLEKKWWGAVPE
jgi:hypothetical protein